jgi:23S rRNA U2552 (ribose-2'-O)-methylase RlmE/FtsJ
MTTSNSITVRLHLDSRPGLLAKALQAVGDQGGDVGAIDIVRADAEHTVRDITVETRDDAHAEAIVAALRDVSGVEVASWSDRTFLLHLGGKIEINSKTPVRTRDQLSMVYTPGVARVCRAIAADPAAAWNLTIKRNTVAVVSDGSAVLGLGNIGPLAAMPVMEGKAQLFKEFAGVDAFPICLATQDTEAVIGGALARLRRYQPGGHCRAALFRNRAPPAGHARHSGVPRRPARHRRGAGGGLFERAQAHRQACRGSEGGGCRGRRRRHGLHRDPAGSGCAQHHRL